MTWFDRQISQDIQETLDNNKSILLFGPRQTGKTSLVKTYQHDLYINLMDPNSLRTYEANPGYLIELIDGMNFNNKQRPLIIIDEIQKIPSITDAIQVLIDDNKAQFILTGSSARKIKNLLPGRVIKYTMRSLSISENQQLDLEQTLVYGSLPGIINCSSIKQRESLLKTYVNVYLDEEIRKEALVRNLRAFNNFLRLACIDAGNLINLSNLSQEIGVSHTTIAEYFQILVDCMVVEKIEPFTNQTTRKRLTKAPKYLFFDLGVRRLGADEPAQITSKQLAHLFEQFIGLELFKIMQEHGYYGKIKFYRDHAGPEIDYIIEINNSYIPIEVKWTKTPTNKDYRHLKAFAAEYPEKVSKYKYIICRAEHPLKLADDIVALPWQQLAEVFRY